MRLRLFPLVLALLVAGGCDSADDELTLDADFYVGTWSLVRITDGSGDRSAEALALLDALTIQFDADRSFRLDADFVPLVNQAGQADVTIEGDYQAQATTRLLVLLVDGLAPTLQVNAASRDEITLTAPAVVVEQLLGELQIDFTGDVTLGIERQ
ncbi:hypothetical protein [Rubrivirga sp.]|uniref:hypothetical protein n=1 Tax=Rubrivirga sp. TaxID=1885344 RepID=UPI003B52A206